MDAVEATMRPIRGEEPAPGRLMRYPRTLPFVALLLALAPGALSAQTGAIEATIRSEDGGSLEGVRMRVQDSSGRTVGIASSLETGRVRLPGLAPGSYTVTFTHPGRRSVRRQGVPVTAGDVTALRITLELRPIRLNPVTVTAARHEEKLLDAPASLSVVSAEQIEAEPAITVTDHLEDVAGVDIVRTGLENANIVTRGFNSLLSGRALTLIDNRIARVPSIRGNFPRVFAITNFDIDRIEVVRGPGSALYGLNAAQGVVHMVTKSPIDDPGIDLSIAAGPREQDEVTSFGPSTRGVFHGEARVAHRFGDRFGAKLSGRYFRGTDWRFQDPVEAQNAAAAQGCLDLFALSNPACQLFAPTPGVLPDSARLRRIGDRDFKVWHWTLDGRADWRPRDDVTAIFAAGLEFTGNSFDVFEGGTSQTRDAITHFGQARVTWGDWFGQVFFNRNQDVGENNYLLRTGVEFPEESWNLGAQLQHSSSVGTRQRFIYGADVLRVTPVTGGALSGIHEKDDEHLEAGLYLQSETSLGRLWDLTLALRADWHTVLEEALISPRAGIVFGPAEGHRVRATFNRAFTTPSTNSFFLDLLALRIPLGGPFSYGVRAQGTADRGFSFRRFEGRPAMKSPFAAVIGSSSGEFLPTTTEQLYVLARELLRAQGSPAAEILDAVGIPSEDAVGVSLLRLNVATGQFEPLPGGFTSVQDLPAVEEQVTNTLEVGYKGLVGDRLLVTADIYYTLKENFIGPFRIETPNAFLNGEDLVRFLVDGGVDEETARALAIGTDEQPGLSRIPLGVVVPREVADEGPNILLTAQNFRDVDVFGTDLAADIRFSEAWELGLAASVASEDHFEAGGIPVALNAPAFKARASAGYTNESAGFRARASYRFVKGFPVNNGSFVGDVDDYQLVDLRLSYELPGLPGTTLQVDVQNLTDAGYRPYVGVPEMGRFTMFRLLHRF